jgi:hypothetical protein
MARRCQRPLVVTPASGQDRAQVEALAAAVWDATGESVGLAWADQGYTGDWPVTVAGLHVLLAGVDVAIIERRASQDLIDSRGGLHARTIEVLDEQVLA